MPCGRFGIKEYDGNNIILTVYRWKARMGRCPVFLPFIVCRQEVFFDFSRATSLVRCDV